MSDPIIDVEAVEETAAEQPGTAVIPTVPSLAVTPQVEAAELKQRLDVIREAQEKAMVPDVDYGVIPGTNKPTLLKPGAEKLSVLFQLDVQLENEKTWDGDHLTVVSKATVYHAPTGARLGYGEGVCTTKERKYAFRKGQRLCPECGKPTIIKGKKEYGGGWLCFAKKGGCGGKWPDGAEVIESQSIEDVPNPDLPDLYNTVVKMAQKRARVDAVLAVTGASALFTQDVEDFSSVDAPGPTPAHTAPSETAKAGKPSDGQRQLFERLAKKVGFADSDLDRLMAWCHETLNKRSISAAIDGLNGKDGDPEEVAQRLDKAAREWAKKRESVEGEIPADWDGLKDDGGEDDPFGTLPEVEAK